MILLGSIYHPIARCDVYLDPKTGRTRYLWHLWGIPMPRSVIAAGLAWTRTVERGCRYFKGAPPHTNPSAELHPGDSEAITGDGWSVEISIAKEES